MQDYPGKVKNCFLIILKKDLRSLGSSSNGSFGEKVREEISELAKNPNNFLIEEDNYMYTFEFSLDEKKYIA